MLIQNFLQTSNCSLWTGDLRFSCKRQPLRFPKPIQSAHQDLRTNLTFRWTQPPGFYFQIWVRVLLRIMWPSCCNFPALVHIKHTEYLHSFQTVLHREPPHSFHGMLVGLQLLLLCNTKWHAFVVRQMGHRITYEGIRFLQNCITAGSDKHKEHTLYYSKNILYIIKVVCLWVLLCSINCFLFLFHVLQGNTGVHWWTPPSAKRERWRRESHGRILPFWAQNALFELKTVWSPHVHVHASVLRGLRISSSI